MSSHGLPPETWRKVVEAIEESIPLYDEVNDLISFGKAQETRKFAIQKLQLSDGVIHTRRRDWARNDIEADSENS